jgi:hypothetical protein
MAKLCLDLLVGAAMIFGNHNFNSRVWKILKQFDFNVFGLNVRDHFAGRGGKGSWIKGGQMALS